MIEQTKPRAARGVVKSYRGRVNPSMRDERMYHEFASLYRESIESAFPWLTDEGDYMGTFTIMDALEDAYCNYLDEYVYNM